MDSSIFLSERWYNHRCYGSLVVTITREKNVQNDRNIKPKGWSR